MTDFFVCEFVFLATFTKKGITDSILALFFFQMFLKKKSLKLYLMIYSVQAPKLAHPT